MIFNGNYNNKCRWHYYYITTQPINYFDNMVNSILLQNKTLFNTILTSEEGYIKFYMIIQTDVNSMFDFIRKYNESYYTEPYFNNKRYISHILQVKYHNNKPIYFAAIL